MEGGHIPGGDWLVRQLTWSLSPYRSWAIVPAVECGCPLSPPVRTLLPALHSIVTSHHRQTSPSPFLAPRGLSSLFDSSSLPVRLTPFRTGNLIVQLSTATATAGVGPSDITQLSCVEALSFSAGSSSGVTSRSFSSPHPRSLVFSQILDLTRIPRQG